MADCKPCAEKKAVAQMQGIADHLKGMNKWFIQCYCGLIRTIPQVAPGEEFSLKQCPKCGTHFRGRFDGTQVEHLL